MTLICRPYFLLRLTFSFISGQIISVCMECSYPRAYSSDFSQIKKLAAVKTHSGNDIPIGIKSNEISYFYPRIVLPAVSGTFAISTYSLKHEILTAANVLKSSVPSTLKLACIGLACVLSVGPTPKHCGNGVVRFRKQAWEHQQQRSACYHLTPTVPHTDAILVLLYTRQTALGTD